MKRLFAILCIFVLFFSLAGLVRAEGESAIQAAALTIDVAEVSLSVEPGEDSQTSSFRITNTGTENLTNVRVSSNILTSDEDDDTFTLTLSPTMIGSLTVGGSVTVQVIVSNMDNKFDVGTVSGNIFVSSDQIATQTLPLKVRVVPLICPYGEVGNDLSVDIKQPDGDYKPGDKVPIEIEVDNDADDNIDVRVEVEVYNLDESDKIVSLRKTQNINDGDSKTFEFEFEMPFDDISLDDNIVMYVIAYDDDHEASNCVSQDETIELVDEEDLVIVRNFELLPLTGKCGDTIDAQIEVRNVGTDSQEDVYTGVSNSILGISARGDRFDLDELGDNDDAYTQRLSFTIPVNAKAGTYELRGTVHFNGGTEYLTQEITITDCVASQPTVIQTPVVVTPVTPQEQSRGSVVTGGAVTDKNVFENLNKELAIPWGIWVILIVIVVLAIIAVLVALFRR